MSILIPPRRIEGFNTALTGRHISNCIINISEDIILEINAGVIVLKAGSKVYTPHNAEYDVSILTTNISITPSSLTSNDYMLFYDIGGNLHLYLKANCNSGTATDPQTTNTVYYDIANNVITEHTSGGSHIRTSLPLAIINYNGTSLSIKQVFNGFGYIGYTAFALPNVRGLVPNGRNTDGTLKNQEFTINSVLTTTDTSGATGGLEYYVSGSSINRANFGQYTYNEKENKILDASGNRFASVLLDGNAHRTSGKVDGFNPKTTFHAADYTEVSKQIADGIAADTTKANANANNFTTAGKSILAGIGMPSTKYTELTLGATGTTFTAPANGWFAIGKRANATGQYLNVEYTSPVSMPSWSDVSSGATNHILGHLVPVSKNQIIKVNYTAAGSTVVCRFYYAEGDKI